MSAAPLVPIRTPFFQNGTEDQVLTETWIKFFQTLGALAATRPTDGATVSEDGVVIPGLSEITSDFKGHEFNLKMWGAVGDGTVDDTAILNTAFNAVKYMRIPKGRFRLTDLVEVNVDAAEGLIIEGSGDESTLLLDDIAAGFRIAGTPGTAYHNIVLRNFVIEGASVNGQGEYGLQIYGVANFSVENVKVLCPSWQTFSRNLGTLTSVVVAAGVATFTTTTAHFAVVGTIVWLQGATGAGLNLNEPFFVATVPSATTFTVAVYGAFPVVNGTYNNAGMILRVPRLKLGIQVAAAQQGGFYNGRVSQCGVGQVWDRIGGIGSNMTPRFGGEADNCPMAAWWYRNPAGGTNGGADDGGLYGTHCTQGRYSVRVDNSGSGMISLFGNHFEYMTKMGLYQAGGRVNAWGNVFYDTPGESVSLFIDVASDFVGSANQCNGGVFFGAGVFSGRFTHNILAAVPAWISAGGECEVYETEDVTHYSNRRMSGAQAVAFRAMRFVEPEFEWQTDAQTAGDWWRMLADPLISGKYRLQILGSGPGLEAVFTVDTATDQCLSVAHPFVNGDEVTLKTTLYDLPGGLTVLDVYFVVGAGVDDFQLSKLLAGAPVDITSAGTGTHAAAKDHGAGVALSGSELFIPTSNTWFRVILPDGAGGYKIACKFDVNGLQMPFGGTGVPTTAKGSLMVGVNNNERANFAVGANNEVLTALSSSGTGLVWTAPSGLVAGVAVGGDLTGTLPNPTLAVARLTVANNLSDVASAATARVNLALNNLANALQLVAANNLSDLVSAATARTNIGLGNVANALQLTVANNLSDLASAAAAVANLGLSERFSAEALGSAYSLTTSYANVTGLSITLGIAGVPYLIQASLYFVYAAPDGAMFAQLNTPTGVRSGFINGDASTGMRARSWIYTPVSASETVTIQAKKLSGAGTSAIGGTDSNLTAVAV